MSATLCRSDGAQCEGRHTLSLFLHAIFLERTRSEIWFCFWVKDLHGGSRGSRSARAARMLDSGSSRNSGAATPGAPGRLTSEVGFRRSKSLGQEERCTGGPRVWRGHAPHASLFRPLRCSGRNKQRFRDFNWVPLPALAVPTTVAADGGPEMRFFHRHERRDLLPVRTDNVRNTVG